MAAMALRLLKLLSLPLPAPGVHAGGWLPPRAGLEILNAEGLQVVLQAAGLAKELPPAEPGRQVQPRPRMQTFLAVMQNWAIRRLQEIGLPGVVYAPTVACPPDGFGVGGWSTVVEQHHHDRHSNWANLGYCEKGGLWTKGGGIQLPIRAAAVGLLTGLAPGATVLDVGSGCGLYSAWLFDWFGARSIGVDFVGEAVDYAKQLISPRSPATFCWMNVAKAGLGFLEPASVDLAIAMSVLHYLRADNNIFTWWNATTAPDQETLGEPVRTRCLSLHRGEGTQCGVAREMLRAVRVGGYIWICHNGSYKGKFDPKRIWGPRYWRCCFRSELVARKIRLAEISELELFMYHENNDPTYSVVLKRLA